VGTLVSDNNLHVCVYFLIFRYLAHAVEIVLKNCPILNYFVHMTATISLDSIFLNPVLSETSEKSIFLCLILLAKCILLDF